MNIFSMLSVSMLTQSQSFIIGPIAKLFSYVLNFIFEMVSQLTPVNSLALTIIIFTLLVKFIMMPMMINQQKSMRRMQEIQPKLKKIQKKYENRKDPESQQKMQMEMQKLYKKHNASPMSGCLPLLIQFPIFIALYQVFRYAPAYLTELHDLYQGIAEQMKTVPDYATTLESIKEAYKGIMVQNLDYNDTKKIIDLIYQFPSDAWETIYSEMPDIKSAIQPDVVKAKDITLFLGRFDLSVAPGWTFPNMLIPIIAGGATYLQSVLMNVRTKKQKKTEGAPDTAAQTQKIMTMVFPVMMLFFSASTPAGLSIYWITSNIFQIIQQAIINRIMDKEEKKRQEELKKLRAKKERAKKKKTAANSKSVQNKSTSRGTQKSNPSSNNKNKPMNENKSVDSENTIQDWEEEDKQDNDEW